MRLSTILKLAGVGAIALIIALVAVVKSIDVNDYRGVFVRAAKAATGRDLAIHGKLSLRLSLTPALIAEDVTLSNAGWGSRPEMIHLQRVRADIGLLPLLVREVRLSRLQLYAPDIYLERNAAGRGNWEFGTQVADAASAVEQAATPTTFKIGQVSVERARIVYRDARDGRQETLTIDQLTADADAASAPIGLYVGGAWNGQRFEVSGVLGAMNSLLAASKPYMVKLKAVLPGIIATANGSVTVGGNGAAPSLSLQVSAEATELADALKLVRVNLPPVGAARVSMGVNGPLASPGLTNIDAVFGRRDMLALTAKGNIKAPVTGEGVDLLLFVEGENLAGLNRGGDWVSPVGPVKGAAHLTDVDGGWRLADLKLTVGHSDLSGDAALRVRGVRPSVEAHLTSSLLDVGELGVGKGEAARPKSETSRLFPDDPLPLALIGQVDASGVWRIDRLVSDGLTAQHLSLSLADAGGKLTVAPDIADIAGGKAAGTLTLDASAKVAAVTVDLDVEKVVLGDLLKGFNISQDVHGARTTLHAALRGNGNSVRAMMTRLSGDVSLVVDKGTIDNAYADVVALDVLRQLAPWTEQRNTQMQCLVSRFSIADGLARSEGLLFDTDAMTVSGQGSINLGNELLDLTVAPKPKDVSLLSMALPLDIGGTLLHPTVTPNRGAIVKGVAGVAGTVALGPLGILIPLVSAGSDDTNACLAAINQAKKPAPPPKKGASKGPVSEVGRALKKLFGN